MTENLFLFQRRVYYSDTDAGGIVYHGNYLRFAEEARIEWLRHLGVTHADLVRESCTFVVTHADLKYLRPAVLDDLLTIETCVVGRTATRFFFHQIIKRDDETLVDIKLTSATVSLQGRARRLPDCLAQIGGPQ